MGQRDAYFVPFYIHGDGGSDSNRPDNQQMCNEIAIQLIHYSSNNIMIYLFLNFQP